MTRPIFSFDPAALPACGDAQRGKAGLERWRKAAQDDEEVSGRASRLVEDELGQALLLCIFGNSPFLGQSILRDVAFTCTLLERGPDDIFEQLVAELPRDLRGETNAERIMTALRHAKRRVAVTTAVGDITGIWKLKTVTNSLSRFAELALTLATEHILGVAAAAGEISLIDEAAPVRGSGYIVLGMGKLGAKELNYSSDIDLIVLYDAEKITSAEPHSLAETFVRATQQLVRIMEERTADGYVFRTDLRLRPDPAATPIAVSTLAAETYYESVGQNWERAALIKARPVAGDHEAGEAFLNSLRPFIWRRHLDFAAIEDIHSIKRQITTHRGGGVATVTRDKLKGHNVKVGRGGIREIEFFAQTQQLIWGGRIAALRDRETCKTLSQLAAFDQISRETEIEMIAAYEFLRRLEHRLQMVDDNQTHSLPKSDPGLAALAAFMGYNDSEGVLDDLLYHLQRVEGHYERLFEAAPDLGGPGSLVFTGSEPDPDTVATLEEMGFADGVSISYVVRGWHHGRYRAMRSARARELLTELMPRLLTALVRTANPDAALAKFDEFLAGLPAGVQLFSLFYANPALLDLVAEIMGSAPRLSSRLSHQHILLDSVLSSEFFEPLESESDLAADLNGMLAQASDFQDVLDFTRRWVSGHEFQIGVQLLRDRCSSEDAGRTLADLADTALHALKLGVEAEFTKRHGQVRGGCLGIIGLGKFGGQELTPESDLDLVFVYDHVTDAGSSDGDVPLPPGAYYARLSQRLISAITSLTPEGRLYDVDMRLRPSGSSGPIAAPIEGFARYLHESAWTWEHMALTRGRIIGTSGALKEQLEQTIRQALTRKRDVDRLVCDIADMRQKIAKEHPAPSHWDIKHRRGGLVDLEFIVQYLQLRHAQTDPNVLSARTGDALTRLAGAGYLEERTADELLSALALWQRLQGMLRLTLAERPDVEAAPQGLHRVLVRTAKVRSFAGLKRAMDKTARGVMTQYQRLIDDQAAAARSRIDSATTRDDAT